MENLRVFSVGALLVLSAACGGSAPTAVQPSSPQPTAAPPAGQAETAPAGPLPSSWSKDMPKEQKVAFMKTHVVSAMMPVFQGANATRYADFSCKTCHGPEFKDPHEYLPKLTMKDGKMTAFAEKPEIAKFMAESVAPKMAAAMGLPPFDMKTGQGFGCAGCHAVDRQ